MDLFELSNRFPTHQSCIKYLETIRWQEFIECPYCYSSKISKSHQTQRHHCNSCNSNFSVLVGTIFHNTKLDLRKWFYAICMILNSKKGISSLQLSRNLKVNKDTAWSLQMRIRRALKSSEYNSFSNFSDLLALDRLSPTPENSNNIEDQSLKNACSPLKVVESKAYLFSKFGDRPSTNPAISLKNKVDEDSKLDYYQSQTIILSLDDINTLEIENIKESILGRRGNEKYWASMKRGLLGQYHKLSEKHLPAYVDECKFKYNQRKELGNFKKVIKNLLFTAPAFIWEMDIGQFQHYYKGSRKRLQANEAINHPRAAS